MVSLPTGLSVLVAVQVILSNDPTLSSADFWRPNRPPCWGIVAVFIRDHFIHMLSEELVVAIHYISKIQYNINRSMVEYIAGRSVHQRNEELHISHSVVMNCGVSLHLWSNKSGWEKEIVITAKAPCFVRCSNLNTRILNIFYGLYSSVTANDL